MSIIIKEVLTKKDLKKWVDFPNKLYKNVPAYVPFLMSDELGTFNKKENPAYAFCQTRLFLAYKDGKIVGRIGGLINHAANQKWGTNNIRFTRFDFIDDFEVSKALFDKVVVKQIKEVEQQVGGIFLPTAAQDKQEIAVVVAVGEGGIVDGNEIKMVVKPGDKVLYAKFAGNNFKIDGEEVTIIRQQDILAIVEG